MAVSSGPPRTRFLPTSRADLEARGWSELDIVIVSGDAYVDHPAFGPVMIAQFLEGRGFKAESRRSDVPLVRTSPRRP